MCPPLPRMRALRRRRCLTQIGVDWDKEQGKSENTPADYEGDWSCSVHGSVQCAV